jgi:hypothetical protein
MTNDSLIPAPEPGALQIIDYDALSGAGFENTSEKDLSLPFLNLLQSNSPEVKKQNAKYVPGAEAGMILNSQTRQVFDGQKGIVIVPLFVTHLYTKWNSRDAGGGFRGTLELQDSLVKTAQEAFDRNHDPKKKLSKHLLLPTGENIVETYYVFALVLSDDGETPVGGVVIPFTSTKITAYKKGIYTPCYTMKGPNGKIPPLFSHRLRLTTALETRPDGESFNYRIAPMSGSLRESQIPSDHPLARVALENYKDVSSGKVKAAEQGIVEPEAESPRDEVFS